MAVSNEETAFFYVTGSPVRLKKDTFFIKGNTGLELLVFYDFALKLYF